MAAGLVKDRMADFIKNVGTPKQIHAKTPYDLEKQRSKVYDLRGKLRQLKERVQSLSSSTTNSLNQIKWST
jgi:hypothetical protein